MELNEELKAILVETAEKLKGSDRRRFMAQTVKGLGKGGASKAEQELCWDRKTIRKGMHEVESGITCLDAFSFRGRKRAEEHLPNLLKDIKNLVDSQSQTDPRFQTTRLYRRISAKEVRHQLMQQKGYTSRQLPEQRTISRKLDQLGYRPAKVAKTKPRKKNPADQRHL